MASKDSPVLYEEIRKHRLEENKKRMEELGLNELSKNFSHNLSPISKSPASRQIRPRTIKETVVVELRRSSRVANNPSPDYREVDVDIPLGRRRARFEVFSASRSSFLLRKYASDEARIHAADRAEKLQKDLDPKNPSFVKPMLQSHVSGGFWLGLPSVFCKSFLPESDGMIVLEDGNCEEWETVYLAHKTGLSGGWRGFSLDHGLQDGDAIVFELVQQERLKVHIVRAEEDQPKEERSRVSAIKKAQISNAKGKSGKTQVKKSSKRKQQSTNGIGNSEFTRI